MSDVNNPDREAAATQTLDGGWFRRERERIAVGRKGIALRLGTTESKVATLEMRKQDVPSEWFGVLRDLGFRMPESVSVGSVASGVVVHDVAASGASASNGERVTAAAPPAVVVAEIADPGTVDNAPFVEVVAAEVIDKTTPPASAVASAQVEVVAAEVVVTPEASKEEKQTDAPVATNPTESVDHAVPADAQSIAGPRKATETKSSDHTPFHGHWLRERRREKGIQTSEMVKKLSTLPADLYTLERHNIRLPLRWIPGLLKLGMLTVDEAKVATRLPPNRLTAMNGLWLRKQRSLSKLSPLDVADRLGVSALDVRLIEARSWPLPVEWFPALKALFSPAEVGNQKEPSSPKATSSTAQKSKAAAAVPTASDAKPKAGVAASKPADKTAAKAGDKAGSKAVVAKAGTKPSAGSAKAAEPKPADKKPAPSTKSAPSKKSAKAPVKSAKATKKPAAKPVAKAPSTSAASPTPTLTETIVSYRLMLGEQAGQSAVDVLAQIAADLQLAKSKTSLTYERLRAAMKLLCGR